MSLLDDFQFDIHDGANAVLTLNESTYQHSFRQILRTNEPQQRIDQEKEKQDVINDKENVEITISEDLADGQNAKLDASLKLLGEDEDDEIHIIETNISATQGAHALQDYQMQLMLLEQQNKKRLREQAAVREDLGQFKRKTNIIEVK